MGTEYLLKWVLCRHKRTGRRHEKHGDCEPLPISLEQLQRIYGKKSSDTMMGRYPVKRQHADLIQPFVSQPLDLDSYDYLIEISVVSEREVPDAPGTERITDEEAQRLRAELEQHSKSIGRVDPSDRSGG